MADLERIWLQHPDDAASDTGRMWCEDKVWPNDPEDGEPTEYVRADLLQAEIARLQKALLACAAIPHMGQHTGSHVNAAIEESKPWSEVDDQ